MQQAPHTPRRYLSYLLGLFIVSNVLLQTTVLSKETEDRKIESIEILQARLLSFFVYFVNDLDKIGTDAQITAEGTRSDEKIIRAKIRFMRAMRGCVFQEIPQMAFVDAWSLLVRAQHFIRTEEASVAWGELTPSLDTFIESKIYDIEEIADAFLTDEEKQKLKSQINDWTERHPIEELNWDTGSEGEMQIPGVSWLLSIPMAPFKAMKGMDTTAQVALQLRNTIELLSRAMFSLPLEASWESELIILKAEESSHRLVDHVAKRTLQIVIGIALCIAVLRILWLFTGRRASR